MAENWDEISTIQLTEEFIKQYKDKVNWQLIYINQKLSNKFIREHHNGYWELISKHQRLSEEFIKEFKDKVMWLSVVRFQFMSNKFIFNDVPDKIFPFEFFTKELVKSRCNKVTWKDISQELHILTSEFVSDHAKKLDWKLVSLYAYLNESTMKKYATKLDWTWAVLTQPMSEAFLEEHTKYLDWKWIPADPVSDQFLLTHKNEFNWNLVARPQLISLIMKLSDSNE